MPHSCSQCGCDTIGQSYSHCADHRQPITKAESYTVWAWAAENEILCSATFKSLENAKLFASALVNADDCELVEIENAECEIVDKFYVLQPE